MLLDEKHFLKGKTACISLKAPELVVFANTVDLDETAN